MSGRVIQPDGSLGTLVHPSFGAVDSLHDFSTGQVPASINQVIQLGNARNRRASMVEINAMFGASQSITMYGSWDVRGWQRNQGNFAPYVTAGGTDRWHDIASPASPKSASWKLIDTWDEAGVAVPGVPRWVGMIDGVGDDWEFVGAVSEDGSDDLQIAGYAGQTSIGTIVAHEYHLAPRPAAAMRIDVNGALVAAASLPDNLIDLAHQTDTSTESFNVTIPAEVHTVDALFWVGDGANLYFKASTDQWEGYGEWFAGNATRVDWNIARSADWLKINSAGAGCKAMRVVLHRDSSAQFTGFLKGVGSGWHSGLNVKIYGNTLTFSVETGQGARPKVLRVMGYT